MNKSINGWEVIESYGDSRLSAKVVPGTKVKLRMRKEILPLFLALAADYNREVAKLRPTETGAFNPRKSAINPKKWSDHASGTAMDLNWSHEGAFGPNGGMKTMTPAQIAACATLKKRYKVVIWGGDKARGGDYANPSNWDPMHFALKPKVTLEKVLAVMAELGIDKNGVRKGAGTKKPSIVQNVVVAENKAAKPVVQVVQTTPAKKAPAKKAAPVKKPL